MGASRIEGMTQNPFEPAPCTRCKGTGTYTSQAFSYEGRDYPASTRPCGSCDGRGVFPGVDVEAVTKLVFTTRGKKRFRASWTKSVWGAKDVTFVRAYYVWRLARFHGGADVTMPMTAGMVTGGDPHIKALDALADAVAKKVFGTDRAAMYRWGNLLGLVKDAPPQGMPASAYECGPVITHGQKPEFEKPELE